MRNEVKDSCKEWVLFESLAAAKCESAPQKSTLLAS